MTMLKTLLSLAALAMLIKLAMAANYTVGAPGGSWDQSTNLGSWASSQKFVLGDNLSSHSRGTTVVTLSSQGTRHFICGTAGHCDQGMKLEIDTTASSAPPPATPSPPPPPPRARPPVSSPPTKSPAPSPKHSRLPSPKVSPMPPVPPPSVLPAPAPSSATKVDTIAGASLGLGFYIMMMLIHF